MNGSNVTTTKINCLGGEKRHDQKVILMVRERTNLLPVVSQMRDFPNFAGVSFQQRWTRKVQLSPTPFFFQASLQINWFVFWLFSLWSRLCLRDKLPACDWESQWSWGSGQLCVLLLNKMQVLHNHLSVFNAHMLALLVHNLNREMR